MWMSTFLIIDSASFDDDIDVLAATLLVNDHVLRQRPTFGDSIPAHALNRT